MTSKSLPKWLRSGVVVALVMSTGLLSAHGVVFDFENPKYTAGANIVGQDYWRHLDYNATQATVFAYDDAISGQNVLRVATDNGLSAFGNTSYGLDTNQGQVSFYFQQAVAADFAGNLLTLFANRGANQIISLALTTPQNATYKYRLGYTNGGTTLTYTAGNVFEVGEWYYFNINFRASDYDLQIMKVSDNSIVFSENSLIYRNSATADSFYGMSIQHGDTLARGGVTYYDDITFQAIPEAGSLALLALGAAGLCIGGRRMRHGIRW